MTAFSLHMAKRYAVLSIFAAFIAGCAGATTSRPFLGAALDGYPVTSGMLRNVGEEFPVKPEIIVFFLQWPKPPETADFPSTSLDAVFSSGAIPCVTWEPMYYMDGQEIVIDHRMILEGKYDSYIRGFARGAKRWGRPFIIRFAHEMNLSRYHWGTSGNEYGPSSPEIYRRMFRYVVDTFRNEGASNVLWAFSPNAESAPNVEYDRAAAWNRIANYYPGDGYVDILGIDGYNWGLSKTKEKDGWDSRWLSFEKTFMSARLQLRELSKRKPLVIFETATTAKGGDKTLWIREAFATAAEWELQGLVWFQVNKEEDWRIGAVSPVLVPVRNGASPQEWLRDIAGVTHSTATGKEGRK
jgi:hypothetical protein